MEKTLREEIKEIELRELLELTGERQHGKKKLLHHHLTENAIEQICSLLSQRIKAKALTDEEFLKTYKTGFPIFPAYASFPGAH